MAVNETLLGSTMTNFTLPSPKRHRKYEETGTIHDEVTIYYGVVWFARKMTSRKEISEKCHFVSLSTGMFGFFSFWRCCIFSFAKFIQFEDGFPKTECSKKMPQYFDRLKWWSFLGTQSHWIVLIQWQPQNKHSLSYQSSSIIEHQHQNAYLSFQQCLIPVFLTHCFFVFFCSCGTFKVSFASPKKILMRSMHSLLDSNTHPWCT